MATQIAQVSPLGLVEMTRKRTRESLEHIMCEPCSTCRGAGFIKTPETVCYEIFREILRQHRQFDVAELIVLAHEDVAELLLDVEAAGLAELEELTGKTIRCLPIAVLKSMAQSIVSSLLPSSAGRKSRKLP